MTITTVSTKPHNFDAAAITQAINNALSGAGIPNTSATRRLVANAHLRIGTAILRDMGIDRNGVRVIASEIVADTGEPGTALDDDGVATTLDFAPVRNLVASALQIALANLGFEDIAANREALGVYALGTGVEMMRAAGVARRDLFANTFDAIGREWFTCHKVHIFPRVGTLTVTIVATPAAPAETTGEL